MSRPPTHIPASTWTDPEAARTAEQVVLHRALDGGWSRAEIVSVLEALGLIDYQSGGRVGALGQRAALTADEQRRRAAQEEAS